MVSIEITVLDKVILDLAHSWEQLRGHFENPVSIALEPKDHIFWVDWLQVLRLIENNCF